MTSLPSRERGLKFHKRPNQNNSAVAPFAGAWIEIGMLGKQNNQGIVAPFAGAWIEICFSS